MRADFKSKSWQNEINEEELTILPDLDALDFHVIASPIKRLLVIDEVQFCPKEKLIQLLEMSNTSEHLDLIVAGLQVGQHGQPFANNALYCHTLPTK